MIQNRMTTVISSHPSSSKWWWSGAIRKTRLPVVLNDADLDDDRQGHRGRTGRRGRQSSSVRVEIASPAMAPPRASDPVSPMKILAGEAFHQRNPKQAPIRGRRDDGQVEGVADLVALGARVGLAVLVELPDADEDVGGEDHRRGAGGQAVEAVGEVHAVGRAGDHDVGPDDEQEQSDDRAGEGQVDVGVPDERDVRSRRGCGTCRWGTAAPAPRRRSPTGSGRPASAPTRRPEAALLGDLDVVVEEPDEAQPGHEERGRARALTVGAVPVTSVGERRRPSSAASR